MLELPNHRKVNGKSVCGTKLIADGEKQPGSVEILFHPDQFCHINHCVLLIICQYFDSILFKLQFSLVIYLCCNEYIYIAEIHYSVFGQICQIPNSNRIFFATLVSVNLLAGLPNKPLLLLIICQSFDSFKPFLIFLLETQNFKVTVSLTLRSKQDDHLNTQGTTIRTILQHQ